MNEEQILKLLNDKYEELLEETTGRPSLKVWLPGLGMAISLIKEHQEKASHEKELVDGFICPDCGADSLYDVPDARICRKCGKAWDY